MSTATDFAPAFVLLLTLVAGLSSQEQGPVLGWEGAIMSVYSREAADWEGSGYGPLLATPSVRRFSLLCSN